MVEWNDAWADLEDFDEADHTPFVFQTAGWLVKDDKAGITLAFDRGEDGSTRGQQFILRGMVRKVRDLK